MAFKLTNIWQQWSQFWAAAEKEAPTDFERLSNYWQPDGTYMTEEPKEAVEGLLKLLAASGRLINVFDGYDQKEKGGILGAWAVEANRPKFIDAICKSFADYVHIKGKSIVDYSHAFANGFADDYAQFPENVTETTTGADDGKRCFTVTGLPGLTFEFEQNGELITIVDEVGDDLGDAYDNELFNTIAALRRAVHPEDNDTGNPELLKELNAIHAQQKPVPVPPSAVPDKSSSADKVADYLGTAMAKHKNCYFAKMSKGVPLPESSRIPERMLKWALSCSLPEKGVDDFKKALKAMAIPGLRVSKGPSRGKNAPAYYVVQCPIEETKVEAKTDVIHLASYSEGWSSLGEQDIEYFMDICSQFLAAPDKTTFWDSLRFQITKLLPGDAEDIDQADIGERMATVKTLLQYLKKDLAWDKKNTREYNSRAKAIADGSKAISKISDDDIEYLGDADRPILVKILTDYHLGNLIGKVKPKSKIVIEARDYTETDNSNNRYTFTKTYVDGYVSIDGSETEFERIQIGSSGFDHFPES
jgi:hypothetical protein